MHTVFLRAWKAQWAIDGAHASVCVVNAQCLPARTAGLTPLYLLAVLAALW